MLLIVAPWTTRALADLAAARRNWAWRRWSRCTTRRELDRALAAGAPLIGINNRDLRTFTVDLATTERLARLLPADVTLVAESGIFTANDVRRMGAAGAHAVLVGEALVTAPDIAVRVRELSSQPREVER
ncbi:MAG: hypothetical protein KatS3mg051_1354 [Anaerolineae bacterium]|nr:MAG: hypothetical protein KatS3mg051_1354 [Anaerolineae bacterium]